MRISDWSSDVCSSDLRDLMKISLFATLALVLVANPVAASAPPFSTEAPIAFMKDLSSGAILYSKDADTRIPPASMAKMMTAHIAFRLLQQRSEERRVGKEGVIKLRYRWYREQ